jgi:hypothetical protein
VTCHYKECHLKPQTPTQHWSAIRATRRLLVTLTWLHWGKEATHSHKPNSRPLHLLISSNERLTPVDCYYWFRMWLNSIRIYVSVTADHGGRAVWGMNCLRSLERLDRVFESHSKHGCLCVRLFCVFVVVCSSSALATGGHSSNDSYRLCKKGLRNWRRGQGPTNGCRIIDEWIKNVPLIWSSHIP